jgi:hypothetical protein
MRSLSLFSAILIACVASATARADIIIQKTPGGGNPDENILFNNGGLNLGPGPTIEGITNQSGLKLDIMSGGGNIVGSGGQATVEGEGGAAFGGSGVSFFGGDFDFITDFKFNVDATQNGSLTVEAFDENGMSVGTFTDDLKQGGQNFFRVTGTNGDNFAKVTITSTGDIINQIRQIRISGGNNGGGETIPPPFPGPGLPEPGSILLWSVLTLAAGAFVVSRRRVEPAASRQST